MSLVFQPKIEIKAKHLYILIAVLVLSTGVLLGSAYGTDNPSEVGHTLGEININDVLDMDGHKITGLGGPGDADDAVDKEYVDTEVDESVQEAKDYADSNDDVGGMPAGSTCGCSPINYDDYSYSKAEVGLKCKGSYPEDGCPSGFKAVESKAFFYSTYAENEYMGTSDTWYYTECPDQKQVQSAGTMVCVKQ